MRPHALTPNDNELRSDGPATRLSVNRNALYLLIGLDLAFVLIHIFHGLKPERIPQVFNIARDGSYAEIYSYLKWAAVTVLLLEVFRRSRMPVFAAMAFVFFLITLDDSLQLHERGGGLVAQSSLLGPLVGAQQNAGELVVFAGLALLAVTPLALTAAYAGSQGRATVGWLVRLLMWLVFFGIIVDALHSVLPRLPYLYQAFDLLEDGGEMIVGSVILAHVIWLHTLVKAGGQGAFLRAPRASPHATDRSPAPPEQRR